MNALPQARGGQRLLTPLLVLGTAALAVVSATQGAVEITLADLWAMGTEEGRAAIPAQVFLEIRLPRIALAVLVGAGLAGAGAGFQGLFRNPLASPSLLGVAAGASAGAAIAIVLPIGAYLPARVALFAFIGALGTSAMVLRLGRVQGQTDTARVLLAGVALTAAASAVVGTLTLLATDTQLRSYTFWILGSLGGATWGSVLGVATGVGAGLGLLFLQAASLDVFALGEEVAGHVGLRVQRLTLFVLVGASLAVGVSVAVSGMIGFLGLAVPHLVRLMIGPSHKRLIPASCALGSFLLLAADTLARLVAAPTEVPIGILTTALGVPFFVWLLRRRRAQWV